MYSITTTVLEGHSMGSPDTVVVRSKKQAIKEMKEWAENASYYDGDEEKEYVLETIDNWDGKETLDFTNGDGEGIVVQYQKV